MKRGEFIYEGEIEYSTSLDPQIYLKQAIFLKSHTSALSIPDNPGSNIFLSNIALAQIIRPVYNKDIILNISCRDYNRIGLSSRLITAYTLGFRNLLLITGDHPSLGTVPESKPVFDLDSTQLLQLCREFNHTHSFFGTSFDINHEKSLNNPINQLNFILGTVVNVHASIPEIEMARFQRKAELGVDFIQTQVIFNSEAVVLMLKNLQKYDIPIITGIVPLDNYALAKKIARFLPGLEFPKEILNEYKKISQNCQNSAERSKKFDTFNIDYYSPIIRELRRKGLIHGLYFATISYPRIIPQIIQKIDG
ncbi:MAG: methylenetetrahydrofolate reductase [Candidatus Lokiarchaeota archaeon]|nr:methylenetetrahydrofolate reductase [Candidatus Harpocratesius repetitus]